MVDGADEVKIASFSFITGKATEADCPSDNMVGLVGFMGEIPSVIIKISKGLNEFYIILAFMPSGA